MFRRPSRKKPFKPNIQTAFIFLSIRSRLPTHPLSQTLTTSAHMRTDQAKAEFCKLFTPCAFKQARTRAMYQLACIRYHRKLAPRSAAQQSINTHKTQRQWCRHRNPDVNFYSSLTRTLSHTHTHGRTVSRPFIQLIARLCLFTRFHISTLWAVLRATVVKRQTCT